MRSLSAAAALTLNLALLLNHLRRTRQVADPQTREYKMTSREESEWTSLDDETDIPARTTQRPFQESAGNPRCSQLGSRKETLG
jgi:hypothetical protein